MSKANFQEATAFQTYCYSSGNFSKNILWTSVEFFLLYTLTDILGIDPAFAGTLIFTSLVFDAVLDPVAGLAIEKVRTRLGQYCFFLYLFSPLASLAFVLLFSLPFLQINHALIVGLSLFTFRFCYTFIDIPHNALMSKISTSLTARSRISGARFFFSSIASLLFSLAIGKAFDKSAAIDPEKLLLFAAIAGVLSTLVMFGVASSVLSIDINNTQREVKVLSLREIISGLLQNRVFRRVLAVSSVASLTVPLIAKSIIYYTSYVLEQPEAASSAFVALIAGQIVGLPLWVRLARQHSTRIALLFAHLTLVLCCLGFLWLPPQSNTNLSLFLFFIGIAVGGIYSMIWGLVSYSVDAGEQHSGHRTESTIFSFSTLSQKFSMGIGAALLGFTLDKSGYIANQVQTAETLEAITSFFTFVPILGSAACIVLLWHFKLVSDAIKP